MVKIRYSGGFYDDAVIDARLSHFGPDDSLERFTGTGWSSVHGESPGRMEQAGILRTAENNIIPLLFIR